MIINQICAKRVRGRGPKTILSDERNRIQTQKPFGGYLEFVESTRKPRIPL